MNNFNQLNVNERNAHTHMRQERDRKRERYIRYDERVEIAREQSQQSQLLARNWRRL